MPACRRKPLQSPKRWTRKRWQRRLRSSKTKCERLPESSSSSGQPSCATRRVRFAPNWWKQIDETYATLTKTMIADTNLALLKLQLLFHGIRAGQDLPSPLTNPFGLIHLALPEKVSVSVHLNTNGTESPFTLRRDEGKFYLDIAGSSSIPVNWTPPLASYQKLS